MSQTTAGSAGLPLGIWVRGQPSTPLDVSPSPTTCFLQRLLLTANGNVERLISSFHGQPAQLYVQLNHRRGAVHDRVVTLMLGAQQLMLAKSTCCLTNPHWQAVLETEQLPIGALFRRFNVLPTFTLHAAGLLPAGTFWRQYELHAPGLVCQIHETYEAACLTTHVSHGPVQTGRDHEYGI